MESSRKVKAIFLFHPFFGAPHEETEKVYKTQFGTPNPATGRVALNEIEYKIIHGDSFDPKPYGENDPDVKILLLNHGPYTTHIETLLQNYPSIEWVQVLSAGVDQFMTPAIKAHPSKFGRGKGSYSDSLAEGVAFYMLWFCKKTDYFIKTKIEKNYVGTGVFKLSNRCLGIIGYGDIGTACARVAKQGFRMKVLGLKRSPEKATEEAKSYVDEILRLSDPESMDRLVRESDFVLNITPLTPETTNLFNLDFFKKMKKTAIFMNIGRGKSVVEDDLVEAIKTGEIAGAYLDVYAQEPLPKESPLWELENVRMTYHCIDWTEDIADTQCAVFRDNLEKFLDGGELDSLVDKQLGY